MSHFEDKIYEIMAEESELSEETTTEEPENDDKTVITMPENTTKKERRADSYCVKVARYQTNLNIDRILADYVRYRKISASYSEKANAKKHEFRALQAQITRLNEIENQNVFGDFK